MTTHFKSTFKNKVGAVEVPYCTRWAMSPRSGRVTENKAEVSCSRCAKQLGIPAAAKELPSNLGTCPCCFRQQKTLKGERMVHHGYNRPGFGYIVGDCFGVKYPRFEDSCEGTIAYRNRLAEVRQNNQNRIAKLVNDEVESLTHTYRVEYFDDMGRRQKKTVVVQVPRGQAEVGDSYDRTPGAYTPSFETLRQREVKERVGTISNLDAHIAEMEEKIASWKKV